MPREFFDERQIEIVIENMEGQIKSKRKEAKMAMDSVLIDMANYTKNNGPWKDDTGNLRNSIGITDAIGGIDIRKASREKLPPSKYKGSGWAGSILRGIIFAGMEYAYYVELMEGKWVLSGTLSEYKNKWLRLMSDRMKEIR